ncbi:hypothetical protein [Desulfuromonas soudanensis]|nr:hypothetical protein [Desulfuromonas soudanensis]
MTIILCLASASSGAVIGVMTMALLQINRSEEPEIFGPGPREERE